MTDREMAVDGRTVALTRQDKVLFPDCGLTKGDLVDYYRRIAATALPLWRGRPLTMERYPDGIEAEGFFEKSVPGHFPDWVGRAELPRREGGTITQVVAASAADLVYLANQACITAHLGLSRTDRIDRPDRLILDLDPPDGDFAAVQTAAREARALLDAIGAPARVMATGSRGLHVVVPLDRSADFDTVHSLARDLADRLAARVPDRLTTAQRKDRRGGRVFVDWLRNAYGQTVVAPYAVRARPGAPVAAPLDWNEALAAERGPRDLTVANLFRRLGQKDDPWAGIDGDAVAAADLRRRLDGLKG